MPELRKAKPGDPLRISASTWNALIDLLNTRDALTQSRTAAHLPLKIRNETGQDLPRFAVIGIAGPLIAPADNPEHFQNSPALIGTLPQPGAPFAITREPIPNGTIGTCLISGITPARVEIYDPDPEATYCEPMKNTVEKLRTYPGGTARILWREPGDTGDKWALIIFTPNPHPIVRVRLMANLAKDSGALVDAEILARGPDGLYVPGNRPTIKVGDLSGLGFSAPAMTQATAELHFGLTINDTFYDVLGILTDIRC